MSLTCIKWAYLILLAKDEMKEKIFPIKVGFLYKTILQFLPNTFLEELPRDGISRGVKTCDLYESDLFDKKIFYKIPKGLLS